jgi:hypothetical protein
MFSSKFNFFNKKVIVSSFTPTAVLLISGTSYTVPVGATSMKAWAVGQGGCTDNGSAGVQGSPTWPANIQPGGAGGCAYKTWVVTGGSIVSYSVGNTSYATGASSTVTYNGTTITGSGGYGMGGGVGGPIAGGSFSGGDGGANGGAGYSYNKAVGSGGTGFDWIGGSVGGNGTIRACYRRQATDVSGLFAAVTLAGGSVTESCGATPAFGTGAYGDYKYGSYQRGGYGGGMVVTGGSPAVPGAVVLYFT